MLKILFRSAIALLLAALLLVVGLVIFVDPNQYKGQVSSAVEMATGREVTIAGDLSWTFLPWIGVDVNDVALSNPKDFEGPTFASAKQAEISIKFWPLLSGHVEVGKITLEKPTIHFVIKKNGQSNWQDLFTDTEGDKGAAKTDASTSNEPEPGPQDHSAGNGADFALTNIIVRDGTVEWEDHRLNRHVILTRLNFKGKNIRTVGESDVSLSFTIADSNKTWSIPVSLESDVTLNLHKDFIQFNHISGIIAKAKWSGTLKAEDIRGTKILWSGQVKWPTFNLADFLKTVGHPLPHFKNAKFLSQFSGELSLTTQPNGLTLTPKVMLDGSPVTAQVVIYDNKSKPITFKLAVKRFNLDDFQPKSSNKSAKNSKGTGRTAASASTSDPLTLGWSKAMHITGNVTIEQLIYQNMKLAHLSVGVDINRGQLSLNTISAGAYKGTVKGSVKLNGRQSTATVGSSLSLRNAQVEPLMTDRFGNIKYPIAGTANVKAKISTAGRSQSAMKGNMRGNGRFSVTNGEIKNLNVNNALNQVLAFLTKTKATSSGDKHTPFKQFSGTYTMKNSVMTLKNILLDSPTMKMKGWGTINFVSQAIHIRLTIHPASEKSSGLVTSVTNLLGGSVPIEIKGTLSKPYVEPDLNAIPKQLLKAPEKVLKAITGEVTEDGKIDPVKPVKDVIKTFERLF